MNVINMTGETLTFVRMDGRVELPPCPQVPQVVSAWGALRNVDGLPVPLRGPMELSIDWRGPDPAPGPELIIVSADVAEAARQEAARLLAPVTMVRTTGADPDLWRLLPPEASDPPDPGEIQERLALLRRIVTPYGRNGTVLLVAAL